MLDRTELENIALLAKLEISEDDFDSLLNDMKSVVKFADKIGSANLSAEGFFGFDDLNNRFRDDEVVKSSSQGEILQNCKTPEEGFFRLSLNKN